MRRNIVFPVRCAVALIATVALGACGGGPTVASGTDPFPTGPGATTTPPPVLGGGSCADPSPTRVVTHGVEARGRMRGGGTVYALFAGVDALTIGSQITTYWRLGGDRALRITMIGPDDRIVHASAVRPGIPAFAWNRPGEPWSSELLFPQPGCWRLYVQRGALDGDVWVRVT